jgi:hypothetical protein
VATLQITKVGYDKMLDAQNFGYKLQITKVKFGTGSGYTPTAADKNLHGDELWFGPISNCDVITDEILDFLCICPEHNGIASVYIGEIGLYLESGELFALGVYPYPFSKAPTGRFKTHALCLSPYLATTIDLTLTWSMSLPRVNHYGELPNPERTGDNAYVVNNGFYRDWVRPSMVTRMALTAQGPLCWSLLNGNLYYKGHVTQVSQDGKTFKLLNPPMTNVPPENLDFSFCYVYTGKGRTQCRAVSFTPDQTGGFFTVLYEDFTTTITSSTSAELSNACDTFTAVSESLTTVNLDDTSEVMIWTAARLLEGSGLTYQSRWDITQGYPTVTSTAPNYVTKSFYTAPKFILIGGPETGSRLEFKVGDVYPYRGKKYKCKLVHILFTDWVPTSGEPVPQERYLVSVEDIAKSVPGYGENWKTYWEETTDPVGWSAEMLLVFDQSGVGAAEGSGFFSTGGAVPPVPEWGGLQFWYVDDAVVIRGVHYACKEEYNALVIPDAQQLYEPGAGTSWQEKWTVVNPYTTVDPLRGMYWVVSVPGILNGVVYQINDWIVYHGSGIWDKVDNTELPYLLYRGTWSALGGLAPPAQPVTYFWENVRQGHYWMISEAGTIAGKEYSVGDWIVWTGIDWDQRFRDNALTAKRWKTARNITLTGGAATGDLSNGGAYPGGLLDGSADVQLPVIIHKWSTPVKLAVGGSSAGGEVIFDGSADFELPLTIKKWDVARRVTFRGAGVDANGIPNVGNVNGSFLIDGSDNVECDLTILHTFTADRWTRSLELKIIGYNDLVDSTKSSVVQGSAVIGGDEILKELELNIMRVPLATESDSAREAQWANTAEHLGGGAFGPVATNTGHGGQLNADFLDGKHYSEIAAEFPKAMQSAGKYSISMVTTTSSGSGDISAADLVIGNTLQLTFGADSYIVPYMAPGESYRYCTCTCTCTAPCSPCGPGCSEAGW